MTIEQIKSLTDEELRFKLAEALGENCLVLPDYVADLNVIQKEFKALSKAESVQFLNCLEYLCRGTDEFCQTASARTRAEALYMTKIGRESPDALARG